MGTLGKNRIAVIFLCGLLAAAAACSRPAINDAKLVDLTYDFDDDTIYWPADMHFHRTPTHAEITPGGYWYDSATYAASEHGGTHLDSPIHFGQGKMTSEQIPVSRLVGPAEVIDIAAACAANRDYLLSVADIQAWERQNQRIPDGAIVLVRTGWGSRWPDKLAYLGSVPW